MVPLRGDAPRSSGYLPGALLLSYGGGMKMAEHQRIAAPAAMPNALRDWSNALSRKPLHSGRVGKRSGFRDRFLVYAGRAPLKFGSPAWTRTMTIGLTGRQAPLPHQGK